MVPVLVSRVRLLCAAVLLPFLASFTAPGLRAAAAADLSMERDSFGVSGWYVPRWKDGLGGGEPNYHFLMLGGRFRLTPRLSVSAAVGVYANQDRFEGPDFLPLYSAVQFDVVKGPRGRFYLAPQQLIYVVTDTYEWVGSTDQIYAYGVGLGGVLVFAPGTNIVVEPSFYIANTANWERSGSYLPEDARSEIDFSGPQLQGYLEIAF